MKRFTIALAGLALATSAQAADTTDFKWNAEMRHRYTNDTGFNFQKEVDSTRGHGPTVDNTGAASFAVIAGTKGRNYNGIAQRIKLGVGMTRGEAYSGYVSIINNSFWGDTGNRSGANGAYTYGTPDTNAAGNVFIVSEAWGWWKASDMTSVKFGRSQMEIAGGAVASPTDWNPYPNTFDGVWTIWDFEPVSLNLFGTKLADTNTQGANTATALGAADDKESVMYGIVAGVKNLPEFLKKAEVHLLQTNDETTTQFLPNGVNSTNTAAITNTDRSEIMRYGLIVGGDVSSVDYKLIGDFYTGKRKISGNGGNTGTFVNTNSNGDQTLSGSMVDLGVGFTLPEIMMLRIGGMYHMDSGGEVTATDNKTYRPFHYNDRDFGGAMDLIQWGNLTYWNLNLGIKPMDDLSVRLDYFDYSRTSDRDGVTINGVNQGADVGTNNATNTRFAGTQAGTSNKIGTEIDFTVNKSYGDNFNIWALYGVFTPGEFIKGNPAGTRDDVHTRIQLQSKLTF